MKRRESAWLLPEIKKFMGNVGMEKADFNTCAYQDTKRRWKKAGRFGGKLSGNSSSLNGGGTNRT